MRYFRKQHDGQWKVVRLSDEEIVQTENKTIDYILRIRDKIFKRASEKNVELPVEVLAASINMFGREYDSFASDHIEYQLALALAEKIKAANAAEAKEPPF